MYLTDVATLTLADGLTELQGAVSGAGVSLIFVSTDEEGEGPRLHQHPYPETFVIRSGAAIFTVGNQVLIGSAGQVIVVPALTPHKFAKTGPNRLEMIDVHASNTFITDWLE